MGGLQGHTLGEEAVGCLGVLEAREVREGSIPLRNFLLYPLLLVLLSPTGAPSTGIPPNAGVTREEREGMRAKGIHTTHLRGWTEREYVDR